MTDQELIAGVLAEDPLANLALVRRAMPIFQRTAARLLLRQRISGGSYAHRQDLADLMQELFRTLWEHRQSLAKNWDESRGSLDAYLSIYARSRALDKLRSSPHGPWSWAHMADSQGELVEHFIEVGRCQAQRSSEDELLQKERLAQLERLLAVELTDEERTLLDYSIWQEQTATEIGQAMGLSQAAVNQRLYRLRKKLQDLLNTSKK